jgi:cytidylate kinase
MPVITIRGQLGSGVPEIAREIARLLPGDYVDREIIESIAKLVGHPTDDVVAREHTPVRLTQRIKGALESALARSGSMESAFTRNWKGHLNDAKYLDALKSVIQDLALEENIVIHGRGSQFILHNNPSALHILVIAPLPVRINRIMTERKVDEDTAEQRIEEYDNSRRTFIQRFFKRDIEDPAYYDLVVNTEHLAYDLAARVIVRAVQRKSPWGHV